MLLIVHAFMEKNMMPKEKGKLKGSDKRKKIKKKGRSEEKKSRIKQVNKRKRKIK